MLDFGELSFSEIDGKVRVSLYGYFYKDFEINEIGEEVGEFEIVDGKLKTENSDMQRVEKKFMRFFRKYKRDLIYKLNGNKAVFVDEDMNIPLLGLQFMGIVDKGSEMLEIKPITNCNADCSFCSVNEGPSSDKKIDFVIDVEYLIKEIRNLLVFKESPNMSIWINPHGEPTLYSKLVELCEGLAMNHFVKDISVITNGMLLDKNIVDELAFVSKKHKKEIKIAMSLSAVSEEKVAKDMMGKNYNVDICVKNMEYASLHLPLAITPVFLCWMNEEEIIRLVKLAQKLSEREGGQKIKVQIQKFCSNKKGRNPGKEQGWDDFFEDLKKIEEKTGEKLGEELEKLQETPQLPVLCNKGDKVKVRVVGPARYPKDKIGVLETPNGNRAVLVVNCMQDKGTVKGTVIQNKYNMAMVKC